MPLNAPYYVQDEYGNWVLADEYPDSEFNNNGYPGYYDQPMPRQRVRGGAEAYLDRHIGGYKISGRDRHIGKVTEYKGRERPENENRHQALNDYAALGDAEKLRYENRANHRDVTSAREQAAMRRAAVPSIPGYPGGQRGASQTPALDALNANIAKAEGSESTAPSIPQVGYQDRPSPPRVPGAPTGIRENGQAMVYDQNGNLVPGGPAPSRASNSPTGIKQGGQAMVYNDAGTLVPQRPEPFTTPVAATAAAGITPSPSGPASPGITPEAMSQPSKFAAYSPTRPYPQAPTVATTAATPPPLTHEQRVAQQMTINRARYDQQIADMKANGTLPPATPSPAFTRAENAVADATSAYNEVARGVNEARAGTVKMLDDFHMGWLSRHWPAEKQLRKHRDSIASLPEHRIFPETKPGAAPAIPGAPKPAQPAQTASAVPSIPRVSTPNYGTSTAGALGGMAGKKAATSAILNAGSFLTAPFQPKPSSATPSIPQPTASVPRIPRADPNNRNLRPTLATASYREPFSR